MNRHKNCILFASFQPDNLCIVRLDKLALKSVTVHRKGKLVFTFSCGVEIGV